MTCLRWTLCVACMGALHAVAVSAQPSDGASTGEALADAPPVPVAPEVITRDERNRATVRAIRLAEPIRLDGQLNEGVYGAVRPFGGLIQNVPDTGQPASQVTDVWVLFDTEHLYVSARCWDDAPPSEWIANEMRRDAVAITNNDSFAISLDTFYDRRNGYIFITNALAAIRDGELSNDGNSNMDANPIWNVRSGRIPGAWTIEMQIPFKSLRYPSGVSQIWGIQIRRAITRRHEFAFLTAVPATYSQSALTHMSLAGTLVGLEVPPGGSHLDVKPYAISGLRTDSATSPSLAHDLDADVGLDVKYSPLKNLTFDMTYNTDFAQVEDDEQQVNLTRFRLVFPEKREFFLEGRAQFEFARGYSTRSRVGVSGDVPELFFSRRIGLDGGRAIPIIGGGRMVGKFGRTEVGVLSVQTDDVAASDTKETNFTVVRVSRDIKRRARVGAIFTGRSESIRAPGRSNQAYGFDGAVSYRDFNVHGFYAQSETPGLAGSETSYQARLDYNADRYGLELDHVFVGDAFNPEVGFVRRADMRRTYAQARFSPRLRSSRSVRQLSVEGGVEYILNTAGTLESRNQSANVGIEFHSSDRVSLQVDRYFEFLPRSFRVAGGPLVPPGEYGFGAVTASYAFGPQRRISGRVALSHGTFYDGAQTMVGVSGGRVQVTPRFTLEPSMSLNAFDFPFHTFTTLLLRNRVSYSFTTRMFVSSLLQYNSTTHTFSTNLRLRWEYSPGSELFVVYSEDRDTDAPWITSSLVSRGLVVKLNRLFRF